MIENEYNKAFSIRKVQARKIKNDKNQFALDRAHEIRKFEIELYWKRTAYFWTIIAAIFAGFLLMASKKAETELNSAYLSLIAFTGFVFSYAWFLVNKGSKFWQENWEYHIDCLENQVTGPLYKTVLYKKDNIDARKMKWKNYILSSESISVSKVNQFIALFTMFVWASLFLSTIATFWGTIFSSIAMLIFIGFVYNNCKTDLSDKDKPTQIKIHSRETKISE
ncbi:hypothetical protein NNQ28_16475 [Cronobacter dublinensis]|uniref:RipA family octameric membrane protein n=1 Tax=Cronobacter dublinensis TaxID=413497 RepID=UPI00293032CB|nr:hypothetical protein [Cronobacter dublinensis]WNY81904.1 hypothetical protein NNQ28_16475 [Cronobacter dublinensis]